MELKQRQTQPNRAETVSFNRTFMELKYACEPQPAKASNSFNRTFMELKYVDFAFALWSKNVLIVPLWN